MLIIAAGIYFLTTKEKYEDVANVVVLNPINLPPLVSSATRDNNIVCDTSNPDYPICLDVFKIIHPRTVYNVNQ